MSSRLCRGLGYLAVVLMPAAFVASAPANDFDGVTIGAVQGVVGEDADRHASTYQGKTVRVQGVVTQKTAQRRAASDPLFGFFLQEPASLSDGNPDSSDGIFVYLGGKDRVRTTSGGDAVLEVGDHVVLLGRVKEHYYQTQLDRPQLQKIVRRNVDVAKALPAVDVELDADLATTRRRLERVEGMRVRLGEGYLVQGGRKSYDEIYLASPQRAYASGDPYAKRVFRDAHPLDDRRDERFDNGNGDRIVIGGQGLWRPGSAFPSLPPARTYDRLAKPVAGGLGFSYGKYIVHVDARPVFTPGPDPSANHAPSAPVRPDEISFAIYNVENLYDHRNDPTDPNDFATDPGEGVGKPFNYLPSNEAEYRERVRELAQQIVADLHAPEVVMLQEIEDQDLLAMQKGKLVGAPSAGDGGPDTAQDLALAIEAAGGPPYRAAYDRDGADIRGIVQGFLYRADRVRLAEPRRDDPVLGATPALGLKLAPHPMNRDVSNPKAVNLARSAVVDEDREGRGSYVFSRAAQVGLFEVFREEIGKGTPVRLYLVNNHLSSRPADRVEQRRLQAKVAGAIARSILDADSGALVAVGWDMNVYPRPDDPFVPGQPGHPSDQLAGIYDAGLTNLYDRMLELEPAGAYTYVYEGQAQTLDQLFVSKGLLERVTEARAAHINCDWPADHVDDGPRGASDHDPVVVRIRGW